VKIDPKLTFRALLLAGGISFVAVVTHVLSRSDTLDRVMVLIGALFLGSGAAGFPWLCFALFGRQKEEEIPGFFVFGMRFFFMAGFIGWLICLSVMFDSTPDGREAAVSGVSAIALSISAWFILQRKKAPNQPPQTTRAFGPRV